jgi:hypothetical protein
VDHLKSKPVDRTTGPATGARPVAAVEASVASVVSFPFSHPCSFAGCDREGSFGEDCFLLAGELGKWFCFEHWKARQASPIVAKPKLNQPWLDL